MLLRYCKDALLHPYRAVYCKLSIISIAIKASCIIDKVCQGLALLKFIAHRALNLSCNLYNGLERSYNNKVSLLQSYIIGRLALHKILVNIHICGNLVAPYHLNVS